MPNTDWLEKYAPPVPESTRQYLELTKAEARASRYGKMATEAEARAIAISNAAQYAIDRWEEGEPIGAAMEALQVAIDTKHSDAPLMDVVIAAAEYRITCQYSTGEAAISAARAKLFDASLAVFGKRWETDTTNPQSPTSAGRLAVTEATSLDADSASCTIAD